MKDKIKQIWAKAKDGQLISKLSDKDVDQILNLHFKYNRAKDKMFFAMLKKFDLAKKQVADIGCGYGHYLYHFSKDSYGVDISDRHIRFANGLGLKTYQKDIINDSFSDIPKAQVGWSFATIEHIDSPHIFLRKCNLLIEDNGTFILECPIRPISKYYRYIPFLKNLWNEHGDHVSFFTIETLKWSLRRSGFEPIRSFKWSIPLVNKGLPPMLTRFFPFSLFASDAVIVSRKIPNWDYPERSIRVAQENTLGFKFKEEVFDANE